jgi:coenzyme F420-reducing hydrogenase delta subunit
MENMSAAMAGKFVDITREMTQQIEEMGPNPLKHSESVDQREE